ncbi:MAG: PAS domain S-box protein, partial [Nitrospinae bacterium]|nr:PAS domain S-box protein [Nitrospinota bacterium]
MTSLMAKLRKTLAGQGGHDHAAQGEAEQKYRALMEHASDAILLATRDGRLIEANRQAETLFGASKEQLATMNFTMIHPRADLERYQKAFASMWETGHVHVPDAEIVRADGAVVPVSINASVIDVGGERVAQGS